MMIEEEEVVKIMRKGGVDRGGERYREMERERGGGASVRDRKREIGERE